MLVQDLLYTYLIKTKETYLAAMLRAFGCLHFSRTYVIKDSYSFAWWEISNSTLL